MSNNQCILTLIIIEAIAVLIVSFIYAVIGDHELRFNQEISITKIEPNNLISKVDEIINSIDTNNDFLVSFQIEHFQGKIYKINYKTLKRNIFNENSNH